jgi:hypothetical protein
MTAREVRWIFKDDASTLANQRLRLTWIVKVVSCSAVPAWAAPLVRDRGATRHEFKEVVWHRISASIHSFRGRLRGNFAISIRITRTR